MNAHGLRAAWSRLTTGRRIALVTGVVVGVAVVAAVVLNHLDDNDGLSFIDSARPTFSYVACFVLIALDAVIPIFPGETTLNAAATAAANGPLDLWKIMVAGALGAIVGDSSLFWIARLFSARLQPQLEKAQQNERVQQMYGLMDSSAPMLIVGGRYVPGMRFVVNASMGLSGMRYWRFLCWSALGGTLWSVYTCLLAYKVATTLAGYPLASVVISGFVTTAALAAIFVVVRKRRRLGPT
jgi:membrane-associated protein